MSGVDAVSIFAEGTFEEQILELVSYLARGRTEEEQAAYIQPFQDALSKSDAKDGGFKRQILGKVLGEVKGLGDGPEREVEGFFNLLFSHFLALFPESALETRQQLSSLLQVISSADAQPSIKLRILTTLFNTIPRQSGLRLLVHQSIVSLSGSNGELEHLQFTPSEVDKWVSEWNITSEERAQYLKTLVDAYANAGLSTTSYEFQLSYVRSIPPSSPSAQSAALEIIASALRQPTVFDFDPLIRLDAVVSLKSHELLSLLQIFLNEGLAQYKAWSAKNAALLSNYKLDGTQLERKIRLLTLASLGFQSLGRDIPYAVLASAIQVPETDVERWVIDAIRAKLISAKLSQTTKTVLVSRATVRTFGREQWEILEKRLVAWKSGLAAVLETVAAAKRRNNSIGVTESGGASGLETPAQQAQEAAA